MNGLDGLICVKWVKNGLICEFITFSLSGLYIHMFECINMTLKEIGAENKDWLKKY